MSKIETTLDKADAQLVAAVRSLHIGTQVARFLRLTLFAFLAQLPTVEAALGSKALGWSAIAAVIVGAAETGFRQAFPSFRLDSTASVVAEAVKSQATAIATGAVNTLLADAKTRQTQVESLLSTLKTSAAAEATKLGVPIAEPPSEPASALAPDPVAPAADISVTVAGSVLTPGDIAAAVKPLVAP
jgi:hypothetical protein